MAERPAERSRSRSPRNRIVPISSMARIPEDNDERTSAHGIKPHSQSADAVESNAKRRPSLTQRFDCAITMGVRRLSASYLNSSSDELEERIIEEDIVGVRRSSWIIESIRLPSLDPNDECSCASYGFPLHEIPVLESIPRDLCPRSFESISFLAHGSNSEVFTANLQSKKVVIKMMKSNKTGSTIAMLEYDIELEVLQRLSHPHIMQIYGSGVSPRRFAVLEYLKGRTLADKLESKLSIADKVFHKPRFPLTEVLLLAEQLADALDYLHRRFHPDACIIHRDIKPDNIGFSSDGSVKIFDFGLCVCVKKFTKETAAYTMSGNTGTLRYMAPEVALEQAYNEKVDIYSLGILLWQVAADAVPYHGITRREFMKFVVRQEARPVLSFSWSLELRSLFERMWDADATSRPTSLQVLDTVRRLRTMDTDGTTIA